MSKFHYSQVRVKFEDEDGSGPGVNRGFFASLANAIKQSDIVSSLVLTEITYTLLHVHVCLLPTIISCTCT